MTDQIINAVWEDNLSKAIELYNKASQSTKNEVEKIVGKLV